MFAHGRGLFRTSSPEGADAGRVASARRRSKPTDACQEAPMDNQTLLAEPTTAELADALDRADAGFRLAVPSLYDRTQLLPIDEAPVTEGSLTVAYDRDVISQVAEVVARARHDLAREVRHLDKNAPRHLRIELEALVENHDEYLQRLSFYAGSDS